MAFRGSIETDTSVGAGTVAVVEPLIPAAVAVTVVVPCVEVETYPLSLKSLLIVPTLEDDELHNTDERTCVPPPVNVPVAVRSCSDPRGTDGDEGVIVMLVSPDNLLVV